MKNPKFQIFQGKNGEYYFRLNARNGQQILSSQGYSSKPGCKNGIESVRKNASNRERYEKKVAKSGKYYFNLLAANKQIIGSSQMYASEQTMRGGIDAVGHVAAEAPVEDTTQ